MRKLLILCFIVLMGTGFRYVVHYYEDSVLLPIPPSKQRTGGDVQKGYEYLTTGDYVKGGIPYSLYVMGMGKDKKNYLKRTGNNESLSHEYTAVKASNGELLVAPNCLQCHSQAVDDKLYVGMGNTFANFADDVRFDPETLNSLESVLKLTAPKRYEASKHFIEVAKTVGPYMRTEVRGINPADRLTAVLAAHRDPASFVWMSSAGLDLPKEVIPSDVPAWWLLRKKNAMFYSGLGRGDFGRFMMASNILTTKDTAEAKEVDGHMADVLAYIYSLRAPAFPKAIDKELAAKGELIFNRTCYGCHGTYGANESYPNLLVPGYLIGTDSFLYKSNFSNPQFLDWFNKSWFTTGKYAAKLEPYAGYLAPPLDGIWVTAPYLHNGSVPTLEGVLNSKARPKYWSRDFDHPEYDYEDIGWKYKKEKKAENTSTYNTTLPGYGNDGHTFGDKLSGKERKAVIEYLKGL